MKGMIYQPESIQAIIEGRKTQTRRVIKPQPKPWGELWFVWYGDKEYPEGIKFSHKNKTPEHLLAKAQYQARETVYIKEAWYAEKRFDHLKPRDIPLLSLVGYPLGDCVFGERIRPDWAGRLRSPLFLPEDFARHFITITDVRAERVQEITPGDALREGIIIEKHHYCIVYLSGNNGEGFASPLEAFRSLWNSNNKNYPFEANPWVFPYTFRLEVK